MSFKLHIARRYLFAKKKHNVINLISGISMLGIGIGAMALIMVLSAFNGIDTLVKSLYSGFDPDLRIEASKGKTFDADTFDWQKLEHPGIASAGRVLEETVFLRNGEQQAFATLKGVEPIFLETSGMDSMMFFGESRITGKRGEPRMIFGYLVAAKLGIREVSLSPINVYAANKDSKISALNFEAFRSEPIHSAGIFTINIDFDDEYVVAPLDFAQKLVQSEGHISAIEIALAPEADLNEVRNDLELALGSTYTITTREEQNELLYKTNETEKYFTYLILLFIVAIAAFNITGSLSMLILDKQHDIFILKSMGAGLQDIRQIFLFEGLLIAFIGGFTGLALGVLLSMIQKWFGLIQLQGMLVDAYPIDVRWPDVLWVALTVSILGFIAALIPSRMLVRAETEA